VWLNSVGLPGSKISCCFLLRFLFHRKIVLFSSSGNEKKINKIREHCRFYSVNFKCLLMKSRMKCYDFVNMTSRNVGNNGDKAVYVLNISEVRTNVHINCTSLSIRFGDDGSICVRVLGFQRGLASLTPFSAQFVAQIRTHKASPPSGLPPPLRGQPNAPF
jgi:hypothetical protein